MAEEKTQRIDEGGRQQHVAIILLSLCTLEESAIFQPQAMPPPATYDPTAPLAEASPDSAWGALAATLAVNGILQSNAKLESEEEPSTCTTLGELLLPPPSAAAGPTSTDINTPLLLVLVSGSWCAPCRNFTPVLSSLTPTLTAANVTTVFCSACADLESFEAYYAKMPSEWRAVPFDEDGEDDRDDLMEYLGANSLPTLVVLDPIRGKVLVKNAVMEVQAGGKEGIEGLIQRWKGMAKGEGGDAATATACTSGAANAATTANNGQKDPNADQNQNNDDDQDQDDQDDDESLTTTLRYTIPSCPGLICQYFQTQLLSPHLPSALSSIILRRDKADDDPAAMALAETLRTTQGPGERWVFRTAAPALPVNSWGGSLGFEAGAVECWEIERDNDTDGSAGPDGISRAVVNIENETGRLILVFRETIVMERSANGGGGCEVTKTLNLDGVPTMAHGPFRRRWKRESEAIFHALLGTCDRKKVTTTTTK